MTPVGVAAQIEMRVYRGTSIKTYTSLNPRLNKPTIFNKNIPFK